MLPPPPSIKKVRIKISRQEFFGTIETLPFQTYPKDLFYVLSICFEVVLELATFRVNVKIYFIPF
jgi:hypothetical protein